MKNYKKPILFIFTGLPASGKSTLSKSIAKKYNAFYLRIDTVEQALKDLCNIDVQGEGYRLSYRIAADNLKLALNVVADSCNPIDLTRNEWEEIATSNDAIFVNIEVVCSDKNEHKARIETRKSDIQNLKLPTWKDLEKIKYDTWKNEQIIIDTANKSITETIKELIKRIDKYVKH